MSDRPLTRRQLLAYAAAGAGGLLLYSGLKGRASEEARHSHGIVTQRAGALRSDDDESPRVRRFELPLVKPPVLAPDDSSGDLDYYEIRMREGRQEILPGLMTTIWGYNGVAPGPTIEVRRDRHVKITQINELPEPMSVHNHGAITAPEHDGYAENLTYNGQTFKTLIEPGQSWTYDYPNQQQAATYWYHDHALHMTARHVYRGLAGFYLIRDDEEAYCNLPRGDYELPLLLQDKQFRSDGELRYDNHGHEGVEGDVQLVNGVPWPRAQVAARKYRLRLLNGSNWRRYSLSFTGGLGFTQIGTDSGLLRRPQPLTNLQLYPGERTDVIVDFAGLAPGTTVTLRNRDEDARDTPMAQVMVFEVVRTESEEHTIPARLADYEDLTTADAVRSAVRTRRWEFGRKNGYYVINDKIWDRRRFDANPRLGTTEIWEFINGHGGWFHPVHIHLVNFQVLQRSGTSGGARWKAPSLWERGRKDTVALGENEKARVIIKWDPDYYQGFTGPYMIHCHNTDHEDHDMMTQYQLLPRA